MVQHGTLSLQQSFLKWHPSSHMQDPSSDGSLHLFSHDFALAEGPLIEINASLGSALFSATFLLVQLFVVTSQEVAAINQSCQLLAVGRKFLGPFLSLNIYERLIRKSAFAFQERMCPNHINKYNQIKIEN